MIIRKITIDKDFPSIINKKIEALARNEIFSPIWQTIDWSIMLMEALYANRCFFLWAFEEDDEDSLINYLIVEQRLVWKHAWWHFVIWWPYKNEAILELTEELNRLWTEEKAVFTQLEPLIDLEIEWYKNESYKKFIERHTAVINLSQSEDEILANMKQKWRYNIKLARKNWIEVHKAEANEQNLWAFYDLLNETKTRDEFAVNSIEYFREFSEYIDKKNIWWLYFAKYEWEVVAAGIFIFFWKICYYYYWASTSDNEKRKFMPMASEIPGAFPLTVWQEICSSAMLGRARSRMTYME